MTSKEVLISGITGFIIGASGTLGVSGLSTERTVTVEPADIETTEHFCINAASQWSIDAFDRIGAVKFESGREQVADATLPSLADLGIELTFPDDPLGQAQKAKFEAEGVQQVCFVPPRYQLVPEAKTQECSSILTDAGIDTQCVEKVIPAHKVVTDEWKLSVSARTVSVTARPDAGLQAKAEVVLNKLLPAWNKVKGF